MKRFYSKTTQVCYLQGIHRVMPPDAVPIPEARYLEVIANPEPNKIRGHDSEGLPLLVDPPPEASEDAARAWRDVEIMRVQWIRDRHRDEQDLRRDTTIDEDQFSGLLAFMQLLRDWPQTPEFPSDESRPVAPDWISSLVR